MENNNEKIQERPQQPREYTPQKVYSPPSRKSKSLLIGIIAVIVIAIVIIATILLVLYLSQSPLVGVWHITEIEYISSNGNKTTKSANSYIVFNASGNGYTYFPGLSNPTASFTWEDLGGNRVKITYGPENFNVTAVMNYSVNGNHITFSSTDEYGKIIARGEKVNSVPHEEYHAITNWSITIGGKNTKVIKCTDIHPDGTAWYNVTQGGNLEITVYDQNGHPLPNVKVIIDGCGIVNANHTNSRGFTELSLQGVHLASGQQIDEIKITLQYGAQTKSDVISVIRAS